MLTKNLYQQVGLVNVIRGEVVSLVYSDDRPPSKLPLYVVVKFRGYSGGNGRLRRGIEVVCQFLP